MSFLQKLDSRILVLDGAMGTMIHQAGIETGVCNEWLNVTIPDMIRKIHKAYKDAGADIVTTNTFGGNRIKLKDYGLEDKVKQINEAAVKSARSSGCLVAGDIGPTGKFIEPLGELTFEKAYEVFKEQVLALKDADFLLFETFADIKELKAAVIAAKENSQLPIAALLTFEDDRTTTGTDIETAVIVLTALNVDIIGLNCSLGPKEMLPIIKKMSGISAKPLMVQPNAGLPKLVKGMTVFDLTPEELADYSKKYAELGVSVIGGCCGTTPEHIKAIAEAVKYKQVVKRPIKRRTTLASSTKTVTFDKPIIIGERINPTSKKELTEDLEKNRTAVARRLALEQSKTADCLDINVGGAAINEEEMLPKTVIAVQKTVDLPIVLDTPNIKALESALKLIDGKALINSVTAEERSLNTIFPLAKKYGAAVIALTLEKDIPQTKDEILKIADKIIEFGARYIPKEDIIIDCLTMSVSVSQKRTLECIDAIEELTHQGVKTILGISNISHGLPNRQKINSTFYQMAKKAGLSAAIVNPSEDLSQIYDNAKDVLDGKDINAINYINQEHHTEKRPIEKKTLSIKDSIYNCVLEGDDENIVDYVKTALEDLKPLEINDILLKAMNEVGSKFKIKEYYLPQVILSADAMKAAFNVIKKELPKSNGRSKGTIVFATVKNDVHDLGKNIVISLLETCNYTVIDLGKDVPALKIVEAVKKHNAEVVCLSALMTTTITEMQVVVEALREANLRIPVVIGGAVVTKDFADKIQAGYGSDAVEAIRRIKSAFRGELTFEDGDKKITDLLRQKDFLISVELVPLRNGRDPEEIYESVEKLRQIGVDAVSVTKGAGGSLRGGTLPITYFIKKKYKTNSIAHFCCRDQTKQEIENSLIDHSYFGIKNILALRGDKPDLSDEAEWSSDYDYAWQLVKQIKNLNKGRYILRKGFDKGEFREGMATDFCIGVAAHPQEDDLDKEMLYLKKKVEEGAEYAITQMIFDVDTYKNYVKKAREHNINIPIIPGIRPLTKLKQCEWTERVFGLKVPEGLKILLQDKERAHIDGINYTIQLCIDLKEAGAPGMQLFILNDVDIAKRIIAGVRRYA